MVSYRFRFIALCILLVSCFVSPRVAVSDIPFADQAKIMAHATDGNDKQGNPVAGIAARNHHKDAECKLAYSKVNNNEGTDEERLDFIKNRVSAVNAAGGPQGKSPNGACECYYNDNLVIIHNPTAVNRGTAYCKESKAKAQEFCRGFKAGQTPNQTGYGC